MQDNQMFRQGARGCFISVVCIGLAIWAVTVSAKYVYPENPYCRGMIGAGFPVMFMCDDWGGGSPTGSWGKIDFVDFLNGGLLPGGFLVDFLFYFLLTGLLWFTISSLLQKGLNRRNLWWTTLISAGFLLGFVTAFLAFLPGYLRHVRPPFYHPTPTPALSSPTLPGTVVTAPPSSTPIPTPSP